MDPPDIIIAYFFENIMGCTKQVRGTHEFTIYNIKLMALQVKSFSNLFPKTEIIILFFYQYFMFVY